MVYAPDYPFYIPGLKPGAKEIPADLFPIPSALAEG
jgi:hypothetical protein